MIINEFCYTGTNFTQILNQKYNDLSGKIEYIEEDIFTFGNFVLKKPKIHYVRQLDQWTTVTFHYSKNDIKKILLRAYNIEFHFFYKMTISIENNNICFKFKNVFKED